MADLAPLVTATVTILGEIQKQTEGLAKQLQSIAPPQEMNSESAQYLMAITEQLSQTKASLQPPAEEAVARPRMK